MIIGLLLMANLKYKIKVLGSSHPLGSYPHAFRPCPSERNPSFGSSLKSFWHPFHVIFAFLGNAIFALTFCFGVMYLIQEHQLKAKKMGAIAKRLPSLSLLDDLSYLSLKFGFPLLTLGIITGAVWRNMLGKYWNWDPKEHGP